MPSRDEIRAQILGKSHKPKSELIEFFGIEIELRQPTLGEILKAQDQEDRQAAVIEVLINRAFVPGTDEHVFEDTDAEVLLGKPFGADFMAVNRALERLSDVNFLDKKPDSGDDQQS